MVYEDREGIKLGGGLDVESKAVLLPKKMKTIKLDDTVGINLMKTGPFIECGFDDKKGVNYLKLYFSKEK